MGCAKAKAKYKSDADDKVKSVKQGEGLWAYVRVHGWFNQTTEQGMINRRMGIMNPDPVKNDWELSTAIEKWEEKYRTITEDLQEEGLPDAYRMAAVRRMLTGDIKRHVELEATKITTYQQLRSTIMNWAIGRKLERERKSDSDMDIGAASGRIKWG